MWGREWKDGVEGEKEARKERRAEGEKERRGEREKGRKHGTEEKEGIRRGSIGEGKRESR